MACNAKAQYVSVVLGLCLISIVNNVAYLIPLLMLVFGIIEAYFYCDETENTHKKLKSVISHNQWKQMTHSICLQKNVKPQTRLCRAGFLKLYHQRTLGTRMSLVSI